MSGANDAMLARLDSERQERQAFQDGLVEAAQAANRDLSSNEMELFQRAADRIVELEAQIDPLREAAKVAQVSRAKSQEIAEVLTRSGRPAGRNEPVEYRSISAYAMDRWRAAAGFDDAKTRLDLYQRAAAHQITSDNPGIIPSALLEPLLDFVDIARPIVGTLGPKNLTGSGYVSRVTQHTQVAKQTAEKTELASRKMLITKTPIDAETFGGYVNVSRQNVDWSNPNALDVVINDLAGQYSIETEAEAGSVIWAGGTGSPTPIGPDPTPEDVSAAIWAAAGASYAAMQGIGRLVVTLSPDLLGLVGPLFSLINPSNALGGGFTAANFGQGAQGVVSGIVFVMSAGLPPNSLAVVNTAAVSVYEDRIGALQVVEPSVLGVQVAYAGYFKTMILEADGIQKIAVTPPAP